MRLNRLTVKKVFLGAVAGLSAFSSMLSIAAIAGVNSLRNDHMSPPLGNYAPHDQCDHHGPHDHCDHHGPMGNRGPGRNEFDHDPHADNRNPRDDKPPKDEPNSSDSSAEEHEQSEAAKSE